MNNKKRILLMIGIMFLGIGLSFAYYAVKFIFTGEGAKVDATTVAVEGSTITVEGNLDLGIGPDVADMLPGHKIASKIKITAEGPNEYLMYNLIWTGNEDYGNNGNGVNHLSIPLNYTVYEVKDDTIDVNIKCYEKQDFVDNLIAISEICNVTNEKELGKIVATGEIPVGESTTILAEDEEVVSSEAGTNKYYQVILEYPNTNTNQEDDMNLTGNVIEGIVSVEASKNGGMLPQTPKDVILANMTNIIEERPDFSLTSEQADKYEGYCYYNGENLGLSTEGGCNVYYTITSDYYYKNEFITEPIGEGTWSEEEGACYYNGNYVFGADDAEGCKYVYEDWCEDNDEDGINDYCDYSGGYYYVGKGDFQVAEILGKTGVYKSEDDIGPTYYYRGNVEDNYVKFAGFYWRIIRINGNGTIRMIYAGDASVIDALDNKEEALKNGTGGEYGQIGRSRFNESDDQNEYVGFKYTLGSVHGTDEKSTILSALETWYTSEGNELQNYDEYLDIESGFCGDRSAYTDTSGTTEGGGTGTTKTYYGAYIRNRNKAPSFKCPNSNDLYQTKIGLITLDEVIFAGGGNLGAGVNFYLHIRTSYWTMSPSYFNKNYGAMGYYVSILGSITDTNVYMWEDVRPVINLSANNLTITGRGTIQEPYNIV